MSAAGEMSLQTPELAAWKRLHHTFNVLADELENAADESSKLLLDYKGGNARAGAFTTRLNALNTLPRAASDASINSRAALAAQKGVIAAAEDTKDMQLVADVMIGAVVNHAAAAGAIGQIAVEADDRVAVQLTQLAEREKQAFETTTFVRDQFARIYDARQMRVVLRCAQQLTALQAQAGDLTRSAANQRATEAAEAPRLQAEAQSVMKLLTDNLGALMVPHPTNEQPLRGLRASLSTATASSMNEAVSLLQARRFR